MKIQPDVINFLSFSKSDELFREMATDSIDVLMNIELIFKNKLNLDKSFHEPAEFILESNNIVRNLAFLTEKATKSKSKYLWLYDAITPFLKTHEKEFSILKSLRDKSMHQELIVSEGAFHFGLYKILSQTEYRLKIGLGDINQNKNVPLHYVYRNTESIFQELLLMHYLTYIDINHNDLGECLGVTRRWYIQAQYNDKEKKSHTETIDIYELISKYSHDLINAVIKAYSEHKKLKPYDFKIHVSGECNFINTVLEIDLYPNLFNDFWEGDFAPLNWKYFLEYHSVKNTLKRQEYIKKLYDEIPETVNEYLKLLDRYKNIKIEDFRDQESYNAYIRFITFPHWYINSYKSITLEVEKIYELYKVAKEYVINIDQNFDKVSNDVKNQYLGKVSKLITEIKESVETDQSRAISDR